MAPQAEGDLVAVRTHVLRQSVSQSVRQLVITIFYLPLVLLTVRNDPPAVLQVCVDRTPRATSVCTRLRTFRWPPRAFCTSSPTHLVGSSPKGYAALSMWP